MSRCPTLWELQQSQLRSEPMGAMREQPDACLGLVEPYLSICKRLAQIGPGPFDPRAGKEGTMPRTSATPEIPSLPGSIVFDPMLQVRSDVKRPPQIDQEIFQALRTLDQAHRLAGRPYTTITSWYRDLETNVRNGGALNSLHLRGLAFDLAVDAGGMATYRAWRSMGLDGKDERSKVEAPHWHLEFQSVG